MSDSAKIRWGENMKKIKNNKSKNNKIKGNLGLNPSKFDPFGSYTGVAKDGEKPVQDQDDL